MNCIWCLEYWIWKEVFFLTRSSFYIWYKTLRVRFGKEKNILPGTFSMYCVWLSMYWFQKEKNFFFLFPYAILCRNCRNFWGTLEYPISINPPSPFYRWRTATATGRYHLLKKEVNHPKKPNPSIWQKEKILSQGMKTTMLVPNQNQGQKLVLPKWKLLTIVLPHSWNVPDLQVGLSIIYSICRNFYWCSIAFWWTSPHDMA